VVHWLGLYDTYNDGCTGCGDIVHDTPADETGDLDYTAAIHSSCNPDLPAPVMNFMHSTLDCCANLFTEGQV